MEMVLISMYVLGEILGRICSVRLGLWAHHDMLLYLVFICTTSLPAMATIFCSSTLG